jgi:hypothetical protein
MTVETALKLGKTPRSALCLENYTEYYLILPIVPGGARNRVAGVRWVKPIRNWHN